MVLSRAWLSFFIAGSGIFLLGMAYDATPQRYLSPGGKVDVSFESPDPLFVVDPDRNNSNNAGLRTFCYQIAFYKPGSHTAPIATTDFYDVQTSSREAFPRPLRLRGGGQNDHSGMHVIQFELSKD